MKLSVIIPTRNRAQLLAGALQSLAHQTVAADLFEVLVIDNGSADSTREVVERFAQRIPHFRYFYQAEPGLHVGRNLGCVKAQTDLLVYADDDIEAFPTWLEGIAEAFEDEQVGLVGGKNLPKFEAAPPDWLVQLWNKQRKGAWGEKRIGSLSILDLGDVIKEISPYDVVGCNFSIRKAVLLKARGFHPDAMPQKLIRFRGDGESHVSQYIARHGYKTLYHPKASIYHVIPGRRMTQEHLIQQMYSRGISMSYTLIRNGKFHHREALRWKLRQRLRIALLFGLERRRLKAHFRGFCYHQAEVKKDPELYQWVMRPDYFDKNGGIPTP